jgi:hypothetical protein
VNRVLEHQDDLVGAHVADHGFAGYRPRSWASPPYRQEHLVPDSPNRRRVE